MPGRRCGIRVLRLWKVVYFSSGISVVWGRGWLLKDNPISKAFYPGKYQITSWDGMGHLYIFRDVENGSHTLPRNYE